MRVIIVEDETAAAVNLQAILSRVCPDAEILVILETVTDTVTWIKANPAPDLVFMDIHLADADAFRIFEQTEIVSPVIFTTAYDQYALEAFKVNSIDYLLKPLKEEELVRALTKFSRLTTGDKSHYTERVTDMAKQKNEHRHSFLVHIKDRIIPLRQEDIAYFYTSNEKVSAGTLDSRVMPIDGTLDNLMNTLPDTTFFRANRQFIISRSAVQDISVWFGSRLNLNLTIKTPERIIISKARVPEFKRWLTISK